MARIALAGFSHETNTFSPIPTTFESFAVRSGPMTGIIGTDELMQFLELYQGKKLNLASMGFHSVVAPQGIEVFPVLVTYTEPSGQVPVAAFNRIVDMITDSIQANGPFEGVFLDLHGAMVYEDFKDGEEEIVRRVKAVTGNIPVVASFDLHGNITVACVELASALVGCRTYPHIDMYETGERCGKLMLHLLDAKPLYKAFRPVPFLWPVSTQSTFIEPCKSLFAQIEEVEKNPDVLSATIMAGFQSADVFHQGPTVFTYGTSQQAADESADWLLEAILAREDEFRSDLPDATEAVQKAMSLAETLHRPVILADVCDNPGGGGTSETIGILQALLDQDAQDAAIGMIFDPETAERAHQAGEGAEIEVGVGGKLMPGQQPCVGIYKVEKLHVGEFNGTSPINAGLPMDFGKMAQLRRGGVRIVISSHRTQANDRQMFEIVGIKPEEMKIVAVKSANHFRADFEAIAGEIIAVDEYGASIENPEKADYKNLRKGVRLQGHGKVY
jgi:microcystin degradation protein MlrC